MHIVRLDGPDDPRLSGEWRLDDPGLVRGNGLFVAEGRLVVQRLLGDGRYAVRAMLLSDAALAALAPPLERLPPDVPVFVCRVEAFRGITGFNIHRGCLALVERPPDREATDVLRGARTVVVLEGVANPDNLGGVFRNAAAFAADAVLLGDRCCDPFYRKTIRTSMGASLRVPFARLQPWPGALAQLRDGGFTTLALTPREPAATLGEVARGAPYPRVALLVGAEGEGLRDGTLTFADCRVRIPISPAVDSLNLAVAAGIALARLTGAA